MKTKEFVNLSQEELEIKKKALKEELYKINMQRYTGNVEKPHMFSKIRKDIARINTILQSKKEKKNG
jgi:large subunit ribosomal protein L29